MRILSFLTLFYLLPLTLTPALADGDKKSYHGSWLEDGSTMLSISATESVEVEQDLLVASLRYEVENKNAKALQDDINALMAKALAAANKIDSVKASTQQYNVYQYIPPRPRDLPRDAWKGWEDKNSRWKGQQGLQLKGKNADDLLELLGDLQEMGLMMNSLSYMLSPEKSSEVRDNLMESALIKLQARAERAAAALGKSSAELRKVTVQSSNAYMPMQHGRMEMMSMDAVSMSAPVAQAGDSNISLTVTAKAILK